MLPMYGVIPALLVVLPSMHSSSFYPLICPYYFKINVLILAFDKKTGDAVRMHFQADIYKQAN